ncbi:MAG: hypothetical protein KDD47_27385, partial [Acidobacteria bacterium]|nr:hypothetical protein [Acidobacteriota bacterium]
PPLLYLEIKNIRRVSDDIQKRLYEIAETALEMKTLYGDLQLVGQQVSDTAQVDTDPSIRKRIRAQLTASPPTVVAFFICAKAEAEKYRSGAETFIDRVFFQEEVDACIDFIRRRINEFESGQR